MEFQEHPDTIPYVPTEDVKKGLMVIGKWDLYFFNEIYKFFSFGVPPDFLPLMLKEILNNSMRNPEINPFKIESPSFELSHEEQKNGLLNIGILNPGLEKEISYFMNHCSYSEMPIIYKIMLKNYLKPSDLGKAYLPSENEKSAMEQIYRLNPDIAEIIANFFKSGTSSEDLPPLLRNELVKRVAGDGKYQSESTPTSETLQNFESVNDLITTPKLKIVVKEERMSDHKPELETIREPISDLDHVAKRLTNIENSVQPIVALNPSYKEAFIRIRKVNPGYAENIADFLFKYPIDMIPKMYKEILDAYTFKPEFFVHAYSLETMESLAMIKVYKKNPETAKRMATIFTKGVPVSMLPWSYKKELEEAMKQVHPELNFNGISAPSYIAQLQRRSKSNQNFSTPVDPYLEVALSRIYLFNPGKAKNIAPYVYNHPYHMMIPEYKEILEKFMNSENLKNAYFPTSEERKLMNKIQDSFPETAEIITNFFLDGIIPEQLPVPIKMEIESIKDQVNKNKSRAS